MRKLAGTWRNDAEHRPKRLGDGHGLGEVLVSKQNTDPTAFGGIPVVLRLIQFRKNSGAGVEGWLKKALCLLYAKVLEKRRVIDHVKAGFCDGVVCCSHTRQHEDIAFAPVDRPHL